MNGYQRLTIIGRLGQDPQLRMTHAGAKVSNFNVAINERIGLKERTTWVRLACFERLAELCQQYLKKGSPIFAEGRMEVVEEKPSINLIADRVIFLADRNQSQKESAQNPEPSIEELV